MGATITTYGLRYIRELNEWSVNRIANGDIDFDDVVYKTREATRVLLDIWDTDR